ncbi:ribonuclease H-like domain-containing protein [Xylariales sp. PMI_506]|nr:ribonuclease H-like domain-containing protein [Xylariales sp. PMI_506]
MVYTMVFNVDGACRRNGQANAIGAAAACLHLRGGHKLLYRTRKLRTGYYDPAPTNQRAEIAAIILALKWVLEKYEELDGYPRLDVTIRTDSRYAEGCMTEWIYKWVTNGWTNARGEAVANRDLIQKASDLDDRVAELGKIKYVWVPRSENTDADQFCNEALDEQE